MHANDVRFVVVAREEGRGWVRLFDTVADYRDGINNEKQVGGCCVGWDDVAEKANGHAVQSGIYDEAAVARLVKRYPEAIHEPSGKPSALGRGQSRPRCCSPATAVAALARQRSQSS